MSSSRVSRHANRMYGGAAMGRLGIHTTAKQLICLIAPTSVIQMFGTGCTPRVLVTRFKGSKYQFSQCSLSQCTHRLPLSCSLSSISQSKLSLPLVPWPPSRPPVDPNNLQGAPSARFYTVYSCNLATTDECITPQSRYPAAPHYSRLQFRFRLNSAPDPTTVYISNTTPTISTKLYISFSIKAISKQLTCTECQSLPKPVSTRRG